MEEDNLSPPLLAPLGAGATPMIDQTRIPRPHLLVLRAFVPKRFETSALEEIKERYAEIEASSNLAEARRYLRFEVRSVVFDYFYHHLKIVVIVEGIRLWFS